MTKGELEERLSAEIQDRDKVSRILSIVNEYVENEVIAAFIVILTSSAQEFAKKFGETS